MATPDSIVARPPLNIEAELWALNQMTVTRLQERFAKVFGESTSSRQRVWLTRRIIWRLQADAEGSLSERARRRAEALALDAEIRVTPPRERKTKVPSDGTPPAETAPAPAPKIEPVRDSRLPPPGNWIERQYKGRAIRVLVVADGFEYEGQRYKSLSAIAKEVTGAHYNGFLFFHLWGKK